MTHPEGTQYSINCVTWGLARDAADTAENMRWLGPLRYDVAGFYHILLNKINFAKIGASQIGPDKYCSPRHRTAFNSTNEGLQCVE